MGSSIQRPYLPFIKSYLASLFTFYSFFYSLVKGKKILRNNFSVEAVLDLFPDELNSFPINNVLIYGGAEKHS